MVVNAFRQQAKKLLIFEVALQNISQNSSQILLIRAAILTWYFFNVGKGNSSYFPFKVSEMFGSRACTIVALS
jgi:hypothetical protein